MSVYFNNTLVSDPYFNGTRLDYIYFNGTLVYQRSTPYVLYNAGTWYSGYNYATNATVYSDQQGSASLNNANTIYIMAKMNEGGVAYGTAYAELNNVSTGNCQNMKLTFHSLYSGNNDASVDVRVGGTFIKNITQAEVNASKVITVPITRTTSAVTIRFSTMSPHSYFGFEVRISKIEFVD